MKNSYYITALLQILSRPVKWLASSFQGNDGKASGRKLTAAFLPLLAGYYVFGVNSAWTLYAFIALLVTILMIWGIVSTSNIITLTKVLRQTRKETKE